MKSLEERIKGSPGLLKKYQSDPGLRSRLPSRYLTAQQRTQRKSNQTNALIGQPLASLSGTTLQDIARQVTDGDYKPAYQDIDRQTGVASRETGEIARRAAAYYEALNAANAQRTQAQGAATGTQDARLAGIGEQTQAAIKQAADQGQERIQQDTALRGAGLQADGAKNLAERMAQARAGAAASSQIDRTQGAARGFSAETQARSLETAGANRGGEIQGDVARRGQGMLSDLMNQRLKLQTGERGDYTKNLLSLRDRQGETELAKAQILGESESARVKAAADEAAARAVAAEKRREREFKAAENAKNRDVTTGSASYKGTNKRPPAKKRPTSGLGSLSQDQENTAHDAISSVQTLASELKAAGESQANIRRLLLNGGELDEGNGKTRKVAPAPKAYVNAAMDLAFLGGLSRANVKALHARGLHVGGKYKLLGATAKKKPSGAVGDGGLNTITGAVQGLIDNATG